MVRALVVLAVLLLGCHTPPPRAPVAPLVDAPYELADEIDFAERADALWAIPPGEARAGLRRELAEVLGMRIDRALAAGRLERASTMVIGLAGLWQLEPEALVELATVPGWAGRLDRARAAFARGGADRDAALVLVLRMQIGLATAAADREELDQILAYADDLAMARMGELGRDSGAIAVLTPVIERGLAPPELVTAYIDRVIARANRADQAVTAGHGAAAASAALRSALGASRDVAIALAAAHQIDRLSVTLTSLNGLGRDRKLDAAARAVAAADAGPSAWAQLARVVRGADGGDDDATLRAGLAVVADGLVRFPDDVTLTVAAALLSIEAERVAQPIVLLEAVRRRVPDDAELAEQLLRLYRERLGRLIYGNRSKAAAACLHELETLYAGLDRQFPGRIWSVTWGEVLATYGRGLIGLGELTAGRAALTRSIAAAPTLEALEMLGTVALKTGDARAARTAFERAVDLPGDAPAQQYARAKVLRLAGDAAVAAGDVAGGMSHYGRALQIWADLGDKLDLPPNLAGERLIESGKVFWALGKIDDGAELLTHASTVDPDGADTHIQAVAFLLLHDQYDRARDTFYQALASDRIGDYYKVYMAVWVLAEGRRLGRADDDQAVAYLASRDGALWYDDIARLASGRVTPAVLEPRATTRARRTELAYYTAVLEPTGADAAALFEDVLASQLVLFFEYDMAKRRLGRER